MAKGVDLNINFGLSILIKEQQDLLYIFFGNKSTDMNHVQQQCHVQHYDVKQNQPGNG